MGQRNSYIFLGIALIATIILPFAAFGHIYRGPKQPITIQCKEPANATINNIVACPTSIYQGQGERMDILAEHRTIVVSIDVGIIIVGLAGFAKTYKRSR